MAYAADFSFRRLWIYLATRKLRPRPSDQLEMVERLSGLRHCAKCLYTALASSILMCSVVSPMIRRYGIDVIEIHDNRMM